MQRKLSKANIDGQKIRQILQTPFKDIDGVTSCSVFVELENGIVFELVSEEEFEKALIENSSVSEGLIPFQRPNDVKDSIGEQVVTVVISDLMTSIGVQISGSRILCFAFFGPGYVGPCVRQISPHFDGELFSYWDKQPISATT